MKFVHAADLHLDSPLLGLERYEGAPLQRLRGATRQALANLVDLCLAESAELLLIAGDLYDGGWRDVGTGLFFASEMRRLREGGVRVVWIRGNHDAASVITNTLRLPSNVHELPVRRADSLRFDEIGVVVHGQGFARKAVLDNLAEAYPAALPDLFNIGLLHTSATGRPGHEPYAPCSPEQLALKSYDYWALGHVHQREVLRQEPWVVYPGNLQGRHARETGAKGATLVSVESGAVREVEHRALDVVRWAECRVVAEDAADLDDVLDAARLALESEIESAEGRLLAARVVIDDAGEADAALRRDPELVAANLRALALDLGEDAVWVEKVRLSPRPARAALELAGSDAIAELERSIARYKADEQELARLMESFSELKKRLPAEIRKSEAAQPLFDAEALRAALSDVEALVVPRLTQGEPE